MGGRGDHAYPFLDQQPAHRQGFLVGPRAVIEPGEQVTVHVHQRDHQGLITGAIFEICEYIEKNPNAGGLSREN